VPCRLVGRSHFRETCCFHLQSEVAMLGSRGICLYFLPSLLPLSHLFQGSPLAQTFSRYSSSVFCQFPSVPSLPLTLYKSLYIPILPLQPCRWSHCVSPKCWHLPMNLHGVKTSNLTNIDITYCSVLKCGVLMRVFKIF
jgi:hypothetical protein